MVVRWGGWWLNKSILYGYWYCHNICKIYDSLNVSVLVLAKIDVISISMSLQEFISIYKNLQTCIGIGMTQTILYGYHDWHESSAYISVLVQHLGWAANLLETMVWTNLNKSSKYLYRCKICMFCDSKNCKSRLQKHGY